MSCEQRNRHFVRPGLTGWAQVNGRNSITWDEKLQYDIDYLSMISVYKDFVICIKTIKNVIHSEGITANNMETAEDLGDYLLRANLVDKEEYQKKQQYAIDLLKKRSI